MPDSFIPPIAKTLESTSFLFVYGTLRIGHSNPIAIHLRKRADWVGQGLLEGRKFDLGSYPGAFYEPGTGRFVEGDIFKLNNPEDLLRVLDEYECITEEYPHPHEYIRRICPVLLKGKEIKCWVYLYNRPILT